MKSIFLMTALFPLLVFAEDHATPKATDYLTEAESLDACADELPMQLECKAEFCYSMVELSTKYQPRFNSVNKAEMVEVCLSEIAVDGTGDHRTRRDRCEAWSEGRPAMKVSKADAAASKQCWTKGTCGERIACWRPFAEKRLAQRAKAEPARK
jgi:hypothetical protein